MREGCEGGRNLSGSSNTMGLLGSGVTARRVEVVRNNRLWRPFCLIDRCTMLCRQRSGDERTLAMGIDDILKTVRPNKWNWLDDCLDRKKFGDI
jgi:hypothetical protein